VQEWGGDAGSLGQPSGLGAIAVPGIRPTAAGATNLTAGSRRGVVNRLTGRLGATPAAAGRLGIAPATRSVSEWSMVAPLVCGPGCPAARLGGRRLER
jgi:hypothetical protein